MKKLLSLVLFIGLLGAVSAQAQQYQVATLLHPTNGVVASDSAITNTATITATKAADVTIWVKSVGIAASTNTVTFNFHKGIDGSTFETTPSVVISYLGTGATAVNYVTNVTLNAAGYLRLGIIDNDAGGLQTNSVYYSIKPTRLGN